MLSCSKAFSDTRAYFLYKPSDPVASEQRTDSVYSIPNKDCEHVYSGETKRQFDTRFEEHRKAVFLCKKLSLVGTCWPNQPYNWVE